LKTIEISPQWRGFGFVEATLANLGIQDKEITLGFWIDGGFRIGKV
jgi:hypothetical protein